MRSSRRLTELTLIVMGALVTTAAWVLASLGRFASIPADIGPFLALVLSLFLAAHICTRMFAPKADGMLLGLAGLLNGLGYVFIARLNEDFAAKQATWTFLGIAAYIGTLIVVRRTRMLEAYRYTFLLIGVLLLISPLAPFIGHEAFGARIWIRVGSLNFQPGEFAKIALAIFFAGYLVTKRELLAMATFRIGPLNFPDPKHLGPLLLAWGGAILVMVFQKDLGSSLLFFLLFLTVVWVATERLSFVFAGLAMFAVGAYAAWTQFSHVQRRIDGWLDPWQDPRGGGLQVIEAGFGIASGGITGLGPGRGDPRRVPVAESDFIFATISEELGLLGATAVLMCFVLIVGSGFRIAIQAERPFAKLLAVGLTSLIGFQAFIIIAGVIRLLPLTGVTLPFVSYGGSSLLSNYVLIALLMRISDETAGGVRRPLRKPKPVVADNADLLDEHPAGAGVSAS